MCNHVRNDHSTSTPRLWLRLFAGAILFNITVVSTCCSVPEPAPLVFEPVTLPATWTPTLSDSHVEAQESTSSSTQQILQPTGIHTPWFEPVETWWAVSFGTGRTLRVRSIFESKEGAFILWVQEPGVSTKPNRDLIIKILKDGRLAWQKAVSPMSAEVRTVQGLGDGSMLVLGFDEDKGNLFTLHLNSDGDVLSQTVYNGVYSKPEKTFARLSLNDQTLFVGGAYFKGAVDGSQFVETFANLPEGDIVVAGPIYGTTTGALGGTQSALGGLWAARINPKNQVVWKKVFETKAGPLFIGVVLRNGSTIMVKEYLNVDTIVKIDPHGNVLFWRHYDIPGVIRSISETPDGGILLVGTSDHIIKLDEEGSIAWLRHMPSPDLDPQYAFEASDGALLLILGSSNQGVIASRLSFIQPFPDCDVLSFEEPRIGEHFPLLPANIGASVEITARLTKLEVGDSEIAINETTPALKEICRHAVPTPMPLLTSTP